MLRLRHKQFEEGDKAGKLLASYIKIKPVQGVIPTVKTHDGKIVSDLVEINGILRDFYVNLYLSETNPNIIEIQHVLSTLPLFEHWFPLFLSLWGKANVIKMIWAHRFNYLLQALPVKIPLSYFQQYDRLCNSFLWNGKCPRLKIKRLKKPVDARDLGIPNLTLYIYAFSLRQIIHWAIPPERAPTWLSIESELCTHSPQYTSPL